MRSTLVPVLLFALPFAGCEPSAPPPPVEPVTLQPLLERLDRLVEALHARIAAPAASTAASSPAVDASAAEPARVAVADPDLVQRLEALERRIAALGNNSATHATTYRSESPPKAVPTVAALFERMLSDDAAARDAARRSLFRLTEEQVLQRLGTPDDVRPEDKGQVEWRYVEGKQNLLVRFLGGLSVVIQAWRDE